MPPCKSDFRRNHRPDCHRSIARQAGCKSAPYKHPKECIDCLRSSDRCRKFHNRPNGRNRHPPCRNTCRGPHTLLAHDQPAAQPALQSMEPPQPLPNLPPQYCPPVGVQLSGVQAPLGTHWPDWQTSPLTQSPQASDPPQPSPMRSIFASRRHTEPVRNWGRRHTYGCCKPSCSDRRHHRKAFHHSRCQFRRHSTGRPDCCRRVTCRRPWARTGCSCIPPPRCNRRNPNCVRSRRQRCHNTCASQRHTCCECSSHRRRTGGLRKSIHWNSRRR